MATTYAIPDGRVAMAATLWTGDATTNRTINNSVNGVSFQPDLVWTKGRNATWQNFLQDSVRGAANFLISDTTGAEATTSPNIVSSFASNGFVVQSNGNSNNTGSTYVGWQWKAGGTAVSNTAGSITSSVSANTTAGFSVVTYTGNGVNATVGHGLGVAPSMVIVKSRTLVRNWAVGHTSIGNWANVCYLNTTAAATSTPQDFNSTAPSSSVVSLGVGSETNNSGDTYVAYCFAPVAGYSAFGSYTGNGSSDGPFIYTAMRPRFLMLKRTDATNQWMMFDTSRSAYNQTSNYLMANLSDSEAATSGSTDTLDFLSNGFKLRCTTTAENANGGTYIYMAFAETAFKFSNAR